MEMKLFAFWRYDLFPYTLGGEFTKMRDDGFVYVPNYRGWFRPIKILPLEAGQHLLNELNKLKCLCKGEHTNVDDEYKDKLFYLMPEAIRK